MSRNSPAGWTEDTRPTASEEGREQGWIGPEGETIAVRRCNGDFEVVSYPEQVPDYVGFVEIHGMFESKDTAHTNARNVMGKYRN